jgi:hypothetical protein
VITRQDYDRADYRNHHAIQVEAGDALGAKNAKDETACDRSNYAENNIEHDALATLVDDFAPYKPCD